MSKGGTVFGDPEMENRYSGYDEMDNDQDESVGSDNSLGSGNSPEDQENLPGRNTGPYAKTSWIDDDIDYDDKNISVIRRIGTRDNIANFVNRMITRKGIISLRMSKEKRMDVVKLIRSFIALTDGGNIRPTLNNEDGLRIIHGISFSRGGAVRLGGLTITLSYRGVDVREVNTGKSTVRKLNVGSPNELEFTRLVGNTFITTRDMVKSLVDKTGVSWEVASEVVGEDYYPEHTPEMIKSMVLEKNRYYKKPKPGESIGILINDLNNTTIFDGTGTDPFDLPDIPESVTRDIVESSVSEISERIHERVGYLTNQEIREFSGILNPVGDVDTKIEALDLEANRYRLKALREADPLKEQLYKNIHETAELKSDLIHIVEKGGVPKHNEARAVFEEEVDSNESIRDLSRLERFKKWMKENWLTASSLAVGLAGLLTTVIMGLRYNIKRGAGAVGSFGRSVYNTFRKLAKRLGPVLGPIIMAVGNLLVTLLKYGAMGLAWLASNLWVLVLAIVWMVYDRYGKK